MEGGVGGVGWRGARQPGKQWCIINTSNVGVHAVPVQCNVLYVCVAPHITLYIAVHGSPWEENTGHV